MSGFSSSKVKQAYFDASQVVQAPTLLRSTQKPGLTNLALYVLCEVRKALASGIEINPTEPELYQLVADVESKESFNLSDVERDATVHALLNSLTDYDVLTSLVEDPSVNDIIVRSFDDISYQTGRKNVQSDIQFPSATHYKAFIERLLKKVGKSCTTSTPVVDAALEPHIRACVTHESFSPAGSGPMLTLRIARHSAISMNQLISSGLAPEEVLNYLATMIESGDHSMLIAGEVGTGKTTLVRALASAIPDHQAILCIEDTHEISLKDRKFVRTLLTREANTEGAGRIAPHMAIRTGMRMAMNRIILGEMRDAEAAEAFVDVCSSGHSGVSTIHARNASDALARLELFLLRAQPGVKEATIRKQIANSISLVAFLKVDQATGTRRISEVIEVQHASENTIQCSQLYKFYRDDRGPHWKREAGISSHVGGLSRPGTRMELEPAKDDVH